MCLRLKMLAVRKLTFTDIRPKAVCIGLVKPIYEATNDRNLFMSFVGFQSTQVLGLTNYTLIMQYIARYMRFHDPAFRCSVGPVMIPCTAAVGRDETLAFWSPSHRGHQSIGQRRHIKH
jgi:hypothetical protein